jgi:hypothetical protein
MNVAFGLKAHSGWAALVALGEVEGEVAMTDRRRIDLVDEEWQKQPYHAAEHLNSAAARTLVTRGIDAAREIAIRELRAAINREREQDHHATTCAVLVGSSMPDWSVDEILAVHFRMHKAEGVLFRDVLLRAAAACGLQALAVPEKESADDRSLLQMVAALGKSAGAPWGKDQKDAARAALIALKIRSKSGTPGTFGTSGTT